MQDSKEKYKDRPRLSRINSRPNTNQDITSLELKESNGLDKSLLYPLDTL